MKRIITTTVLSLFLFSFTLYSQENKVNDLNGLIEHYSKAELVETENFTKDDLQNLVDNQKKKNAQLLLNLASTFGDKEYYSQKDLVTVLTLHKTPTTVKDNLIAAIDNMNDLEIGLEVDDRTGSFTKILIRKENDKITDLLILSMQYDYQNYDHLSFIRIKCNSDYNESLKLLKKNR
ncbi:MAG: hypothetical protein R3Y22_08665 [Bacteroidales bacterium]